MTHFHERPVFPRGVRCAARHCGIKKQGRDLTLFASAVDAAAAALFTRNHFPGAPVQLQAVHASPNPFRTSTAIRFALPAASNVNVSVFDAAGQRVRLLAAGARTAGEHSIEWNGSDDDGRALPSGIYFYRVQGGGLSETRKLVFTR